MSATVAPPNLRQTPAPDPSAPGPGGRRHTLGDLYHERTNYQFVDRSWRWAVLSGAMVVVSLLALVLGGLNLGIDFEGGTQWQLTVEDGDADPGDIRELLVDAGQENPKVVILGDSGVRVQTVELGAQERDGVTAALAEFAGVDESDISVTNVGPTWGERVTRKAAQALVIFFVAVALYLSIRFEARMALAAIIAVIHDIVITAGVYAITGFEVTPATVVAFLTILGFSLYDTVVVFDKVKENETALASTNDSYSMMVNRSLNEVLMRSLNTSFVAALPVLTLLVVGRFGLGAIGLQDFALALFVGILVGAYSSIFVATPILAVLKEREPRYRSLRERLTTQWARGQLGSSPRATRSARAPARAPARAAPDTTTETDAGATPEPTPAPAAPAEADASPESAPAPTPEPPAATKPSPPTPGVTPRPRRQRRKRR